MFVKVKGFWPVALQTDSHFVVSLSFAVRDSSGRAYNRTVFLLDRRRIMQVWADCLDRLKSGKEIDANTLASELTDIPAFRRPSYFVHLQYFVAVMVDDLHGELAGFGLVEGPADRAVETAPGGFVDLRS